MFWRYTKAVMREFTWRVVRFGVAAGALCGSPAVLAQGDVFNSSTRTSGDPCQAAYNAAFAKITAASLQSDAQYQKDRIDCGNDRNCVANAQQQRLARERQINKGKIDVETQRSLCYLQQQTGKPTGDPCQDAYRQASTSVLAESLESDAQYKKDRLDCANNPDCVRGAQQRRLAGERQIAKERIDIDAQRLNCGQPAGSRDLSREEPNRPQGRPQDRKQPDDRTMLAEMDDCLRNGSKLVYYSSPQMMEYQGTAAYADSTILYNPSFLDRQPPYIRAFWLGGAFAAHVQNLESRRYDVRRNERTLMGVSDLIIGFLAHCLLDKGLLPKTENLAPDDPRLQFEGFVRINQGQNSPADAWRRAEVRVNDFNHGWALEYLGLPRALTHEP
jgi:hypothetical protein